VRLIVRGCDETLRVCPFDRGFFLRVNRSQPSAVNVVSKCSLDGICPPLEVGRRKVRREARGGTGKGDVNSMGIWWLILIVVGWVVLQVYVLPKFGIST